MKTITVYNMKGGTGKSTSVINIASILASDYDKKVLVIDNDAQGNSTLILSSTPQFDDFFADKLTINELITEKKVTFEDVILQSEHAKNLYYVPANSKHVSTNMKIMSYIDNTRILQKKLKQIENEFDYVLIDCSPNYDLVSNNAFLASDYAIIPIEPKTFSLVGLNNVIDIVDNIKEFNNDFKWFIMLTQVKRNTIRYKEALKFLKNYNKQYIEHSSTFLDIYEKAFDNLKPVNLYNNNLEQNRGYKEYKAITKDLLNKLERVMPNE